MNPRFPQKRLHSKNSPVRFDPEKGPVGLDPFLDHTDPKSRSKSPGIKIVFLTQIPGQSDPKMDQI